MDDVQARRERGAPKPVSAPESESAVWVLALHLFDEGVKGWPAPFLVRRCKETTKSSYCRISWSAGSSAIVIVGNTTDEDRREGELQCRQHALK